jgi:hypothetical protein
MGNYECNCQQRTKNPDTNDMFLAQVPKSQSILYASFIDKSKTMINKCSLRLCGQIPNLFRAPLPIYAWCKSKATAEAVCAAAK